MKKGQKRQLDNSYVNFRKYAVGILAAMSIFFIANPHGLLFADTISVLPGKTHAPPKGNVSLENLSLQDGFHILSGDTDEVLEVPLKVRATENGRPILDKKITFVVVSTPPGAQGWSLSPTVVRTDRDGCGATQFKGGNQAGTYVISAFFESDLETPPIRFQVEIRQQAWIPFLIFGLLGGLGIFLMGMDLSGKGLKNAAGDKMRGILSTLTSNRFFGLLIGIAATAVLQSSSASTVMLVGFVSSTMMTLGQAMGVILGAKIGTTITIQLIAFNLSDYSLILVALGFLLKVLSKKPQLRQTGEILLGFGLIFFGLGIMGQTMRPLRSVPVFTDLLLNLSHYPLLGILIATGFTAVVQSSAATIGLAITLCAANLISLEAALPLAWGAHVGTCATALLSSLGTGRDGKQVAVAHLILSILGVAIAFPFLPLFVDGARWLTAAIGSQSVARELANGHMLFTIITGLLLMPFIKQVEWITKKIIPATKTDLLFKTKYLEKSALEIPVLALDLAHQEILRLSKILRTMISDAMDMLAHPSTDTVDRMDREDDKVDFLEKAIRLFLAKVAQGEISPKMQAREHAFIYIVQDLEGIGDLLTKELAHSARKLYKRDFVFSQEGLDELQEYHQNLLAKYDKTIEAVKNMNPQQAAATLALNTEERLLERRLRESHIERLHRAKAVSVQTSAWHLSTLNNMRAISEKLDDIARTILEEI